MGLSYTALYPSGDDWGGLGPYQPFTVKSATAHSVRMETNLIPLYSSVVRNITNTEKIFQRIWQLLVSYLMHIEFTCFSPPKAEGPAAFPKRLKGVYA